MTIEITNADWARAARSLRRRLGLSRPGDRPFIDPCKMLTGSGNPLLLSYQRAWVKDESRVKVCVKSRRIGITWATGGDKVSRACRGAEDSWYIAYSEDAAAEFIVDCTRWCDQMAIVEEVANIDTVLTKPVLISDDETGESEEIEPEPGIAKEGIQAFRLRFLSGRRITALTSRPRNLRGKQGCVVIDEAAFHDDLPGLLKAAIALLMWGGRVEIISTHNGIGNAFNHLVEDIRAGIKTHSLHEIDLDTALEQGLYRRICEVSGEAWSEEAEARWRQELVDDYGVDAEEELFCKPSADGAGDWFDRGSFPVVDTIQDVDYRERVVRRVRAWDFAATRPSASNRDPDWTRGVLLAVLETGDFVIEDIVGLRDGPAEVQRLFEATAEQDGRSVEIGLWQDPGAGGKADAAAKAAALFGYPVHTIVASSGPSGAKKRPGGAKMAWAKVWAPKAKSGQVTVLRRPWTNELLAELQSFPLGAHDDMVDAISLAFQVMTNDSARVAMEWERALDSMKV